MRDVCRGRCAICSISIIRGPQGRRFWTAQKIRLCGTFVRHSLFSLVFCRTPARLELALGHSHNQFDNIWLQHSTEETPAASRYSCQKAQGFYFPKEVDTCKPVFIMEGMPREGASRMQFPFFLLTPTPHMLRLTNVVSCECRSQTHYS